MRLQLGIAMLVVLTVPRVILAYPERDCIRPIDALVDGSLHEWEGRPYAVLGAGTAQERELCGVLWKGWSPLGVYFAFRIYGDSRQISNASIDVFLDTRSRSAPMDRYVSGVHHWRARPADTADGEGVWATKDVAENISPAAERTGRVAAKRAADSEWSVEGFVPWPGDQAPAVNAWIGLSIRCSVGHLSIGARTVNPYNPLETTPIAFDPVQVLADPPSSLASAFRAEEIVLEYQPWAEIEMAFASELTVRIPRVVKVTCQELQFSEEVPLSPTPSGHFVVGRTRFRLTGTQVPRGLLHFRIEAGDQVADVSVPVSCAQRWAETERRLPETEVARLSAEQEGIVRVLKVAACESAALLATAPDDIRPPQRVYRPIFSPGVYDREWEFFVSLARTFLSGRQANRDFPLRGWRSSIDGSWLPLMIAYPWNYRPEMRYPAKILIEGLVPERNVGYFIAKDLQAEEAGESAFGDSEAFVITLFGRGNSFATLGAEERHYVLDRLLPELPVLPERISLVGGSAGGEDALEVGTQDPGRFAFLHLRSGTVMPFLEQPKYRFDAAAENLRTAAVFAEAGQLDPAVAAANLELAERLNRRGVLARYRVRSGVGHLFSPGIPPSEVGGRELALNPDHLLVTAYKRPGTQAFWARIDGTPDWNSVSRLEGNRRSPTSIDIQCENVDGLSLKSGALARAGAASISINGGRRIAVPAERKTWLAFQSSANGWHLARGEIFMKKRAGSSGPAWQITERRMTVVYGTQEEEATPWLRERAYAVLRSLSGNAEAGQMAHGIFPVYADRDLPPDLRRQCNLWLIGSARQNSVVATARGALPYTLPQDLPMGDERTRLVSYIYPKPDGEGLLFVECGGEPAAYCNRVMCSPGTDLSVQDIEHGISTTIFSADFSSRWKPRDDYGQ